MRILLTQDIDKMCKKKKKKNQIKKVKAFPYEIPFPLISYYSSEKMEGFYLIIEDNRTYLKASKWVLVIILSLYIYNA